MMTFGARFVQTAYKRFSLMVSIKATVLYACEWVSGYSTFPKSLRIKRICFRSVCVGFLRSAFYLYCCYKWLSLHKRMSLRMCTRSCDWWQEKRGGLAARHLMVPIWISKGLSFFSICPISCGLSIRFFLVARLVRKFRLIAHICALTDKSVPLHRWQGMICNAICYLCKPARNGFDVDFRVMLAIHP